MLRQRPARYVRPYGGPSGEIKVLCIKDDSLSYILSGPFREVEGFSQKNCRSKRLPLKSVLTKLRPCG
jgi:hypothetical protein